MGEIKSKTCIFCGKIYPLIEGVTYGGDYMFFTPSETPDKRGIQHTPRFAAGPGSMQSYGTAPEPKEITDSLHVTFFRCPSCKKTTLDIQGSSGNIHDLSFSYPNICVQYPDFVPQAIRNDYSEASLITKLSPKAAATLARRCLQEIIRDYWKITPEFWGNNPEIREYCKVKKDKIHNVILFQEIKAVEKLGCIDAPIITAFKQLKDIGNIGAHPQENIDTIVPIEPGEAETLLKLIDLIIRKTYIQRQSDNMLLQEIEGLSNKG